MEHIFTVRLFSNISGVGVGIEPITPLKYGPAWLDNVTVWSGLELVLRVAVDGKSGEDELVIQAANTRVKND